MDKLNKLIKQQDQNGQEITSLFQNLKRDPSKNTIEIYKTSFGQLETCMKEINKINQMIEELNEKEKLESNHAYFKNNYFDSLKQLYEEVKSHIKKSIEETEKTQATKAAEQARRFKEQEVRMLDLRELFEEVIDELSQDKPKIRYDRLLKEVNRQWEIINNLNIDLKINEDKFVEPYFTQSKFQNIRKVYGDILDKLEEKILSKTIENPEIKPIINHCSSSSNIKLPPLKIPIFDGKYEEWTTFQDMFCKLVHNNASLSTIEKMQFLKSNVRGEASKSIQHFQISDANYETAWIQLQERYNNKRLIINKLINKILDLQDFQNESADKLKNMYNTAFECLEAIKAMNIDISTWGPIIVCILTKKWDSRTNELYETSLKDPMEIQSISDLQSFLLRRFQSLEAAAETKKMEKSVQSFSQSSAKKQGISCKLCELPHSLFQCQKFKELSTSERFKIVKEKKLCTNCLSHDTAQKCSSQQKCKTCDKNNHHTLLHRDFNTNNKKEISGANKNNSSDHKSEKAASSSSYKNNHMASIASDKVLLATALIKVKTASGSFEYLRALVDPGSQAAFITEMAASLLGLPRQKTNAEVSGLGANKTTKCHFKVSATCKPRMPSNYALHTDFIIMPKLTSQLPENEIQVQLDVWQNKLLADPTFYKPGPIDVLLGAHEYRQLLCEGIQKTSDGLLGQNTEFGWIILGSNPTNSIKSINVVSMVSQTVQDEQLAKFWEIDDNSPRERSEDEKICEQIYEKTTTRDANGKYTVKIPFKNDNKCLGDSRSRALARLHQLEKRLVNNKVLDAGYKQFMQEYLDLGHMKLIPRSQEGKGQYYIPHQAVIRECSATTKLRVVFDASCKTSNNVSLNDKMHIGARLQQELSDIILRWRCHNIVFAADIEKMYRQILIDESDQDYQRILWRFNPTDHISEYKLTTITYGTAAAPYLAIRTIHQLAMDEMGKYGEAAKIILRDFYVDDLLSGAETQEKARNLRDDLIKIFRSGGFTLRKWISNSRALVEELPEDLRDQSTLEFSEDGSDMKKSLGIYWAPNDDTIKFKVEPPCNKEVTKRMIISDAARIFDPLGWLSPVTIVAKMFIQELWQQKISWDEKVPKIIQEKWDNFQANLQDLEKIQSSSWTQETQSAKIKFKKTSPSRWKIFLILLSIMFMLHVSKSSAALFTVEYPPPGMYIEHLGEASVDRGIFRIEVRFKKSALNEDVANITRIISQMEQLCKNSLEMSTKMECTSLMTQLKDKERQMERIKLGIQSTINKRQKRGLLGNLMTSIFGVNDEVYQDIDALEKNQQQIIQASNHQTKFMLQALSTFNETEVRIADKLNQFKKKLDEGLAAINEMQKWYRTVDENKMSIHLLSAYQLANNYIDEMIHHYYNMLEVHYNSGNFYKFITPIQIEELLAAATKNLPTNIRILSHPMIRSEVEHSELFIHLYGYFMMSEPYKYMLIKVTPIPLKIENGYYWTFNIDNTIIAVDYNTQHYFQISENNFKQSLEIAKHEYICSPPMIEDIDRSPNCVIDEIYGRTENITCEIIQRKVKTLVFKQLQKSNSWLFITPEVTKVAVTCNGNREDVKLNKTGIIAISQNCIITTKKMILTPKRNDNIPVLAGFARPVVANLTTSTHHSFRSIPMDDDVLTPTHGINSLMEEEQDIQEEIQTTSWKAIHHQSIWTSLITTIIVCGTVVAIAYGIKWIHKSFFRKKTERKSSQKKEAQTEDGQTEDIELTPIYSEVSIHAS